VKRELKKPASFENPRSEEMKTLHYSPFHPKSKLNYESPIHMSI
jgi:hypothetical protein